jgi:hypothetical protein
MTRHCPHQLISMVRWGAKLVRMSRWTAPSTIMGLLLVLLTFISGCSHSERDATGFWASKGVILRISREGEYGEHYILEWKELGRMARGSFGGPFRDASLFRDDARIMGGNPSGDLAYSKGRDVVAWRGERFSRVSTEDYARAAPR